MDNDFVLVDSITSEAFVLAMITCLLCEKDLKASDLGIEGPCDPMDKWAEKLSHHAKNKGWVVSSGGSILCPKRNDDVYIT